VHSDVLQKLVSNAYMQTIEDHKLNPVDMPMIENVSAMAKGTPLSFTAVVEIRPTIELGSYDGIEVKENDIVVTDEELNATIERVLDMYAQLEVVEGRPLENNDTAIIDFEGFLDGKSIEGAKATDYTLMLGSKSFIPGFEEQLIGMSKDETREIKVTFPADYGNKELAGKAATFTIVLKEIKKKVLPELNEEFVKNLGDFKTGDDFKAAVRKDMEAGKKSEQNMAQREEIVAKLIESHTFEVPSSMVDRELLFMARQQATRMARQGVDVKKFFDAAKFREENKASAERHVKGLLLLDVIAEKEKVEVGDADINLALAAMAKSSGQTMDAVKKYYESLEDGLENLRASLKQEKALDLLHSRAKKSYN
jgi:trigger factor